MGIADAILDLVSSGTTLRENNLKEIEGGILLESQVKLSWAVDDFSKHVIVSRMLLWVSRQLVLHSVFIKSCLTQKVQISFRLFLLQAGNHWLSGKAHWTWHMRFLRDWRRIWGQLVNSRCAMFLKLGWFSIYLQLSIVYTLPLAGYCKHEGK